MAPLPARARHVVKMPPTWRGSGCRDGKLAKDLAEFCGSCWAPGQFPDLLLDSTAPPPPSSSSPCECVLKLLGWNLTDCDGVYGQYTIMCSVDSVRYVDG